MTELSIARGRIGAPTEALKVALVAFALGVGLVFVTGFAHPELLHNAAHDTRHALSFPCH